ncbi:sulfate ABC transporter substrate-binding protein [Tundrisphaera sp. TA3]|uniref:sulfate ABC transporter substrate-binding protein n=1 Tax=Tundrisphaera sp. TA3 TaxID=3435775 RepID=UPI003EC0AD90
MRRPEGAKFGAWLMGLLLAASGPSCGPRVGASQGVDTLTLGAYSVVREAFHDGLIPAFTKSWADKTGRAVRFEESYNASGAQSRAIAAGFDADIAVLSLQGDMDNLVKAGVVEKGWDAGPTRGMATRSLVVIGVRDGNPKNIRDWADLANPGVGVLYPDPKTSGGARWNIAAVWGAGLLGADRDKPDPEAARDLLSRVQANVVNMDSSGRQSLATFERGTGDAVVTYENELLLREKFVPHPIPYVTPPATLQIESPAALVEASVRRHGNRQVAQAFLEFIRSDEGQRILGDYGFRPIDPKVEVPGQAPLPPRLFTIKDLGGWSQVKKTVFDPGGVFDRTFTRRGGGK